MAEAFAVVKVGNTEWLFRKSTPRVRTAQNVGVSSAFTEPRRRPSATKMMTLRRSGVCAFRDGPGERSSDASRQDAAARKPALQSDMSESITESRTATAATQRFRRQQPTAPVLYTVCLFRDT